MILGIILGFASTMAGVWLGRKTAKQEAKEAPKGVFNEEIMREWMYGGE